MAANDVHYHNDMMTSYSQSQPQQWTYFDVSSENNHVWPASYAPTQQQQPQYQQPMLQPQQHYYNAPVVINYYDTHGNNINNSVYTPHPAPVASTSQLPLQQQQQQNEQEEACNEENSNGANGIQYSVSDIQARTRIDENGDEVFICHLCDKEYGGKHGRSIWRRHLSNKHNIPLNAQPRRTRWDNDANRPKDEAERHKRTLESKRRWAAKNRAEKREKRKSGRGSHQVSYEEVDEQGEYENHMIQQHHPGMAYHATMSYEHYDHSLAVRSNSSQSHSPSPSISDGVAGYPHPSHYQHPHHIQHMPAPNSQAPLANMKSAENPNFIPYERVPVNKGARKLSTSKGRRSSLSPIPPSSSDNAGQNALSQPISQHAQPGAFPLFNNPTLTKNDLSNHQSSMDLLKPYPNQSYQPLQRSTSAPDLSPVVPAQQHSPVPPQTSMPYGELSPAYDAYYQQPEMVQAQSRSPIPLQQQEEYTIYSGAASQSAPVHREAGPHEIAAAIESSLAKLPVHDLSRRSQAPHPAANPEIAPSTSLHKLPPALLIDPSLRDDINKSLARTTSNDEAALQLLALKTSSPPASPARGSSEDGDGEELQLVGDTSFADSGYGDLSSSNEQRTRELLGSVSEKKGKKRAASFALPSSPVRHFSLSPASSPPPLAREVPAQARRIFAATPSSQSKKRRSRQLSSDEDQLLDPALKNRDDVLLESSPSSMQPPLRRRRVQQSVSPKVPTSSVKQKGRARTQSLENISSSSTLYSSLATPHLSLRNPLSYRESNGNIFKIDNCSRPSASLFSSPGNILLSSPEHAAVSRSLGLVPESNHFASAFDLQFLDQYEGGITDYATNVFGSSGSDG